MSVDALADRLIDEDDDEEDDDEDSAECADLHHDAVGEQREGPSAQTQGLSLSASSS